MAERNLTANKKLHEVICEDSTFSSKVANVQDQLAQYLTLYRDHAFTLQTLKIFLNDDIIRQKIPIDPNGLWSAQTLLTTDRGLRRIRGTGSVQQAFPTGQDVKFYRTMNFERFAEMLGVVVNGRAPRDIVRELPYENTNIKDRITDVTKLGNHFGDFKQARSYFGNGNEAQVMIEVRYNASTFFSPDNLALPQNGLDDLKAVLNVEFPNRTYAVATQNEGTNTNLPGLKSENRGAYSVGLSATAMNVFKTNADSIKVMEYHIP